jgi:hypothetical protein
MIRASLAQVERSLFAKYPDRLHSAGINSVLKVEQKKGGSLRRPPNDRN